MNSLEDIVKSRHSVREYTDKKIEGEVLEKIQNIIAECNNESSLNIRLILNEEKAFGKSHYGNFKNCKNYIVMIGDKKDKQLDEKCGYYGEKIVLKAQELGINSCWVVLTYNKSEVPCNLSDNEKIAIVIALGYGVNNGFAHKGKEFKDVSILSDNIPDWYKKGVEFALLAPTALNQQKFKFELKNDNKVLLKATGIGLYTKFDLGIVKYHFELGAGKENFKWINK